MEAKIHESFGKNSQSVLPVLHLGCLHRNIRGTMHLPGFHPKSHKESKTQIPSPARYFFPFALHSLVLVGCRLARSKSTNPRPGVVRSAIFHQAAPFYLFSAHTYSKCFPRVF
jgi:hypothetical protein